MISDSIMTKISCLGEAKVPNPVLKRTDGIDDIRFCFKRKSSHP